MFEKQGRTYEKDLEVKHFRKLGVSAKSSDLETFCTGVRSTLEDDRWVQLAHMSVTDAKGKKGVFIRPGLGFEPGTDLGAGNRVPVGLCAETC